MLRKRIVTLIIVAALCFALPLQALGMYGYDKHGDTDYFVYYKGAYDPEAYPQKPLNSVFTTENIVVDGAMDEAYADAPVSGITNVKVLDAMQHALEPDKDPPTGTLRSVWDGPVLYLFVEVFDETPVFGDTAPANDGIMTSNPAVPSDRDSVVFGFDLWNDKVVYETDTTAVFTIDSSGNLTFFRNSGIPSLGSVHADPIHPEFTNRIKSYSATKTDTGYNVELALHIEGVPLENGTAFGVDVQICNVQVLEARTVLEPNPWYPWLGGDEYIETTYPEGPGRTANTFWSHDQDSLYAEFDHERPNAVDWGNVTLTGWDGESEFAFSSWRLSNNLLYLDSIRFPKGVWTAETQAKLDLAVESAEEALAQVNTAPATVIESVYAASYSAADELEKAIAGLRWSDTKYPDPMELPEQFTLPDPYQFFGSDGNSTRIVKSKSDWEERREEILDLAQFYEYGYKPEAPDAMTISNVSYGMIAGDAWGFTMYPGYIINTSVTYGDVTKSIAFNLFMPSEEQLQASGHGENVPVVLNFDGYNADYIEAGFAVLSLPSFTGGDVRANEYAWGTRTGVFYEFFPYSRNGEGALKEVSSEMAAAWGASRAIDALELLSEYTTEVEGKNVTTLIDPDKLAVTGFSINGKYAFVSAVFDERIDVCMPGAAGATGPSPWRYVYAGQEYDFSDTDWAPGGAPQQTAFGTEFMANSVRHNRVRETETFRRFLTPGNFYKKIDGAYGYGARLPFDQNDLVATLAPRAIIVENTINDFNDGSVTDALSLDLVKTIYSNLKYDADKLIKYNYRTVQPYGDPHGSDSAQRGRSAEYLNYYFYNEPLSEETGKWLSTNPFTLNVSNNKTESPYDYYYGGYNTITGGSGGVNGTDGWYYYTIEGPVIEVARILSARNSLNVQLNSDKGAVWYASIATGDYPDVDAQTHDATGNVSEGSNTIEFTGLSENMKYYIHFMFVDDLGNTTFVKLSANTSSSSGGSSGGSSGAPYTPVATPTTAPTPAAEEKPAEEVMNVSINGIEEKVATVTKTETDDKTMLTVTLQPEIMNLVQEREGEEQQNTLVVTVPAANETTVAMTGEIVRQLEDQNYVISVQTNNITYQIPVSELAIDWVAQKLELSLVALDQIQIEIRISEVSEEAKAQYTEMVTNNGHELIIPPVSFEITAKRDGETDSIIIDKFSNYVTRVLEIPDGVDPEKITTAIVFNSDGTYSHVPTAVFQENGIWYSKLSSISNSDYALIWNPVTVASVEGHWSEEAVNDLASRLIISNPATFEPSGLITRGEFAQYITKALSLRASENRIMFSDVTEIHPLASDIQAAVEYGIINGFLDGTFKTDATITRQEAMAMYARAMDVVRLEGLDIDRIENYEDKSEVSQWAYPEVQKVLAAGVFNGTSPTTISPLSTFTYAEAVTAIRNLLTESGLINK